MMFNYPYIGYPFKNNYYRYTNNYAKPNYWNNNYNNNQTNNISNDKIMQINKNDTDNEEKNTYRKAYEYLEVFGIKLYFDDILLILLIYFLYTEGVTDIYLFFVLILLLIE